MNNTIMFKEAKEFIDRVRGCSDVNASTLEELGVNEKLKQAGVQDGDTVRVVDWELEWYD